MAIDRLYIARHGYRMNWVTDDWLGVTGTARDPPLAPYGLSQAKELADFFNSLPEEEKPTAVFSSPYYRCLQTARPTAEALNLPLFVEHGLSEWYSPAAPGSGLHPRPGQAADLQSHVARISDDWRSLFYPTRKGEDTPSLHNRSYEFLRALIPTVEHNYDGKHKRILLVSHAATIIGLVRVLVGDRAFPLRVGTCSITDLKPRDGASNAVGNWEAIKLADSSHLKDGASRDWGFEDAVYVDGKVIDHHGEPGTQNEVDNPTGLQIHLLPPGFQTPQ